MVFLPVYMEVDVMSPQSSPRILIVRLSAIGDVIMACRS